MQHRLYGLRGQTYVRKYKEIYQQEKDAIIKAFDELVSTEGKFSAKMLGKLCNQFKLPVTVMDEFLSEATNFRYPSGTWDRLRDKGVKAKDIGVAWS